MEEEEDFGIDNVKIENFMNKSGDNVSKNILRMFPADEKNRLNNINIKIKNKGAALQHEIHCKAESETWFQSRMTSLQLTRMSS